MQKARIGDDKNGLSDDFPDTDEARSDLDGGRRDDVIESGDAFLIIPFHSKDIFFAGLAASGSRGGFFIEKIKH